MKFSGLVLGCGLLCVCCTFPQVLLAGEREEQLALGEQLFRRDWSRHNPAAQGPTASDGLGPLFNAVSCVACHSQGGTGGAGPNDQNVRLLSLVQLELKSDQPLEAIDIHQRAEFVRHPNLIEHDSTVLHRFSSNRAYAALVKPLWDEDRLTLLGWANQLDPLADLQIELTGQAPANRQAMALLRTERNTPALFGAGLIDSIDREDLQRVAQWQAEHYPEISGELAPNAGKFGWRGQIVTLREFVLGACANELGLQVKEFPQANDVLTHPGLAKIEVDPAGNKTLTADMTDQELAALVSYVAELPPPRMQVPRKSAEKFIWERGQRHFAQAQCNACHVERIGMVKGIYSDLLLHDLGPELFDPVSVGSEAVGYFGFIGRGANGTGEVSPPEQEWRTPPLWGVGNSAPYMHDGRAATIDEAIRLHRGEAAKSQQLYLRLKEPAQRELVAYVKSLGAPAGENILASLAKRRGEKIVVQTVTTPVDSTNPEAALLDRIKQTQRVCGLGCSRMTRSRANPLPAELVKTLYKQAAP